MNENDIEILKGQEKMVESYSAFGNDLENTGLKEKLFDLGVDEVYCCGLAFDYCVGSTAESASQFGFKTFVIKDATKSVAKHTEDLMIQRL